MPRQLTDQRVERTGDLEVHLEFPLISKRPTPGTPERALTAESSATRTSTRWTGLPRSSSTRLTAITLPWRIRPTR